MTINKEIEAFRSGQVEFHKLSEQAQELVRHDMLVSRCGFEPTMVIRASGTAQTRVQAVLAKAQKLTNGNNAIPVRIELEDNPHDPDAIVVMIPTLLGKLGEWLAWEKAGYVPRGYCPGCGRNITTSVLGKPACPDCSHPLFDSSGKPTSEIVEFNKFIKAKIVSKETFKVIGERIAVDRNFGKNSYGLSLAFLFGDKNAN